MYSISYGLRLRGSCGVMANAIATATDVLPLEMCAIAILMLEVVDVHIHFNNCPIAKFILVEIRSAFAFVKSRIVNAHFYWKQPISRT